MYESDGMMSRTQCVTGVSEQRTKVCSLGQEEKWAGLLADALHLTESMARERLDTEKTALRTVLNISEEGVAHAPPRPCMSCQAAAHKVSICHDCMLQILILTFEVWYEVAATNPVACVSCMSGGIWALLWARLLMLFALPCVQLAESEAEHAGMRGAAVAALRHLTSQQRRLREAIGGLVPSLAAGDPSEAPPADLELRLAVAARLRQLAQPPPQMATSGRLLDGLLGAVPTAAEVRSCTRPCPCHSIHQMTVQSATPNLHAVTLTSLGASGRMTEMLTQLDPANGTME